MKNLAAITKILGTLIISVAALLTDNLLSLGLLILLELVTAIGARRLAAAARPMFMLAVFAGFLYLLQLICGSSQAVSLASASKMFIMAVAVLLMLLTTKTQQITAALVTQLRMPYQYAFMVTAVLRFVPDVLKESQLVREAQACRGFKPSGNPCRRVFDYMMIIKPMVFRAISRSENMAVSLEMRGFTQTGRRTFMAATPIMTADVLFLLVLLCFCAAVVKFI